MLPGDFAITNAEALGQVAKSVDRSAAATPFTTARATTSGTFLAADPAVIALREVRVGMNGLHASTWKLLQRQIGRAHPQDSENEIIRRVDLCLAAKVGEADGSPQCPPCPSHTHT